MSTKVPKPMIRPPTKAQAKLVNKKTSTDKAGEEKRPQTAADLLSSDEEEEDAGTAPPKKTTTVTKPLTLTQQKELRQLERQNRLTTKPQWSNANIDTPLTATRMRPKAKINEKTLEREQDIDAHWEDRAFGKVRKYDKKRTSIGADGTKVLNRPIVNSKASSGFINPMDEFGDTMEDVNEKIKTNKQRKAKAATKARAPRFEDPVEEFGGLVKDVKSKIRKTKASGWTDPASVFGEVEVPDSPAFSSQADPVFSTPKRKRTTSRTDDIENANESSSSLSDCPSDLSVDSRPSKQLKKAPKKAPKKEEKPKCPICEKELSLSFYKSWGSKAVHKLQKQSEMHAAHEKSDFEKEAVANKYPAVDVNWDKLQKRAAKHMAYLKELTNGKHESPFRKAMKSRKKKDIQYTPGYYGPRGARVLMEQILRVLQDDILAAGQTDRAIAAGGITAFAQCVLVPELGIRLIMEDMKVDSEEAAKIMKATIKMGERLNEDEDDLLEDEEEGEGWLAV